MLDASVLVKWLLADPEREAETDKATALVERVGAKAGDLLLPPHWLAEVAAVLCRLSPATAEADIEALCLLEWSVADDVAVYRRAAQIAAELRHHLFDTLYHAVAIEAGVTLVTADRGYWHKARPIGQIALLEQFSW